MDTRKGQRSGHWDGQREWTVGMDTRKGHWQVTVGMDSRDGQREGTTGMDTGMDTGKGHRESHPSPLPAPGTASSGKSPRSSSSTAPAPPRAIFGLWLMGSRGKSGFVPRAHPHTSRASSVPSTHTALPGRCVDSWTRRCCAIAAAPGTLGCRARRPRGIYKAGPLGGDQPKPGLIPPPGWVCAGPAALPAVGVGGSGPGRPRDVRGSGGSGRGVRAPASTEGRGGSAPRPAHAVKYSPRHPSRAGPAPPPGPAGFDFSFC